MTVHLPRSTEETRLRRALADALWVLDQGYATQAAAVLRSALSPHPTAPASDRTGADR